MKVRYLLLLGLATWLIGCTPLDSLNPLYAGDSEIIYDESLTGTWVSADPNEHGSMEFVGFMEHGKDTGYLIRMFDDANPDNGKPEFEARLVQLGGRRFLDVVPKNWDVNTRSYSLQIKTTKNATTAEPSVIRLGPAAYMRFNPGDATGRLRADLAPAHWFFRVSLNGAKLRLDWIDDEKFRDAFKAGKFHVNGLLLNENKDVVITATTSELQKFLADHADDDALFTEHTEEVQRKPAN
jgi:hypothetical protein